MTRICDRVGDTWICFLFLMISLGGCASYLTPGAAADFRAMGITEEAVRESTDFSIARRLERRPLASFPTALAVVRVQDRGYRSYTSRGYGSGAYTVVPSRDVETEDQFERIAGLPMVRGLAPLNRLVLPDYFQSEEQLREGAAAVQADMLLIYTFDTTFWVENKLAPLGLLTLGLFPDDLARISSTVSAVLMDTRNGYVYALMEATAKKEKLANGWTKRSTVDAGRRQAETEAFEKLVREFESTWPRLLTEYGPPSGVGQMPNGALEHDVEASVATVGNG